MRGQRRAAIVATAAALSFGIVIAPASAAPDAAQAANFTIVMLPDTQYGVRDCPELFMAQTKWVAKNKKSRNIKYVLHVGDVVAGAKHKEQWGNATKAMGVLEKGKVPYLIGVGNHDFDVLPKGDNPDRTTSKFNKHFPRKKFADWPSFGGSLPKKQNDNSYHLFSAGGTEWLALALKYDPTKEEVAWADKVVADHPDRQVMLVTHSYQKGDKLDEIGTALWDSLVRKHQNISFVFSGHHVAQGLITSEGDNQNSVYQIQADYQDKNDCRPNGFLRIMEFRPAEKNVQVQTYSPAADAYKDDDKNKFTLENVEFE